MARRFDTRVPRTRTGIIATAAAIAVSVGAFGIEFSPHTFLLKKYKSILHLYRLGEEIPLDKNVEKLFNEVLDDLKIDTKVRKNIDPFTIVGYNLHYAGIPDSRFGAIIGIPINYTYKDKHSIDTAELRLGRDREPINLYHPASEDLINSLLLSDKAKKFGIAREVLMATKEMPIYRSVESPLLVTSSILVADIARVQFKLTSKPLIVAAYGASALLGYAVWFQIRDTLNTYFEKCVDKELSELGPEYIEGGKEFYEKLLKRNVALRALLGAEGSKQFNRDGDEVFFIRYKRTPITHRKKFFSEVTFQGSEQQTA